MAVTIKEIAEKAGVSHGTVSGILNNKWRQRRISEEAKDKVYAVANALNYRPNNIARSLVLGKTKLFGLIIPCVTLSFWPEVVRGVEDSARDNGYHVFLCHSDDDAEAEMEEINLLRQHRIAGLIICPSYKRDNIDIFLHLQEAKIPFVLLDKCPDGLECNFVGTDGITGAWEATTHLIKLGHRRIGYIRGPAIGSQDRFYGYQKALTENNINPHPELVKGNGFTEDDGYRAMREFLKMDERPTAILAVNDFTTFGAIKAIREKALKIPEDIGLIGFDDPKGGAILEVPLTTVKQPAHEIGRRAVQILLTEIKEGIGDVTRVLLPPELVIRGSCGTGLSKKSAI